MDFLLGKTLSELQSIALSLGLPKYAGKQLAEWLYQKKVTSFDAMTNISLQGRQALQAHYLIGRSAPIREAISQDSTRKYLFPTHHSPLTFAQRNSPLTLNLSPYRGESEGGLVESVFLPEDDRTTLCVSTQAGCKMACRFCMTGTLGFHGNLTAADILNQILSFDLTNIVFMGEGEPMDNIDELLRTLTILTAPWGCAMSPKRITVSSVGIVPGLKRFIDESECHLAISLHNPFDTERQAIMPIGKKYTIPDILTLIRQYDWSHQRRISFEYICWGGVNDTPRHADELVRLLRDLECRINLIRFHEGVDRDFPASNLTQMEWFRDYLTSKGITTTIRKSRGEDILAACGMLVNSLSQ